MRININGTWKTMTRAVININGTWKNITRGVINIAGTWKSILFGSPSIAQQVEIDQTTSFDYIVTLIGYNYFWTNYSSSTYKFQKSVNNGSTWSDIDSGSITNPSSGSYNTKQYQLLSITPNIANLYRFQVTTTSSGGQSETSTSNSTTVQGARNVTSISSSSQTISSINLSWTASSYSSSYKLYYRQTGPGPGYSLYNTYNTNSATVTGLSAATEYAFYVVPYTGTNGQGYPGNDSDPFYQYTSTPPAPGTFSISLSVQNINDISASWSATDATSYYVDIYKTSNGSSVSGYPKNTTSLTSDTITGLEYSTSYRGYGYGINNYGTGSASFSNIVTTGANPTPGSFSYSISATTPYPTYPYNLSLSRDGSANTFTASWTPGSYNSGYVVYLSGLVNSTVYTSSSSLQRSYSSSGNQTATVDTYNSNTKATLSWGSSSGAQSYTYGYTLGGTFYANTTNGGTSVDIYTSGQQITLNYVYAYSGLNGTGYSRLGTPSGTMTITPQQTSPQFGTMPSVTTFLNYTAPGVAPSVPRNISGSFTSTSPNYVVNWTWDRPLQGTGTIEYRYSVYSRFTQSGTRSFRYSGSTFNTFLTTSYSSSFGLWAQIDITAWNDYGNSSTVSSPVV